MDVGWGGLVDRYYSALLDLELLGCLDVPAWCTGMLEVVLGLVVIATLGNTELVALGAQEVREYWMVG